MKIVVIGGGYVGLVAAVCFCEFGFDVTVVDLSIERIENLKNNKVNFFEPGIEEAVRKFQTRNKLRFSNHIKDCCSDADVILIAVSTIGKNGEDCDLTALHFAISELSQILTNAKYRAIIIRTSVPVGTCKIVNNNMKFLRPDLIQGEHYDIISNPGFVREGTAMFDFISPERVVIGLDRKSEKAQQILEELYRVAISAKTPFIYTDFDTTELIRYISTAFVVTKMALLNEIIPLCEKIGSNIDDLVRGISLDSRIGPKALQVNPGIGGSSYPRTVRTLQRISNNFGVDLNILNSAIESNKRFLERTFNRIMFYLNTKKSENDIKNVCIFGLSFKAKTNDIRESPSIYIIKRLLENEKIKVSVYDPLYSIDSLVSHLIPKDIVENNRFALNDSPYEAATQQDVLVMMADWMEFRNLDYHKISELMTKNSEKPVLIDFKNMFTKFEMKDFEYIPQGNHK